MYVCNSDYVAGESTVRTVTYTDWQTRNGPVDKTVTQLVTPKIVVCDRYGGIKAFSMVPVCPWEKYIEDFHDCEVASHMLVIILCPTFALLKIIHVSPSSQWFQ